MYESVLSKHGARAHRLFPCANGDWSSWMAAARDERIAAYGQGLFFIPLNCCWFSLCYSTTLLLYTLTILLTLLYFTYTFLQLCKYQQHGDWGPPSEGAGSDVRSLAAGPPFRWYVPHGKSLTCPSHRASLSRVFPAKNSRQPQSKSRRGL